MPLSILTDPQNVRNVLGLLNADLNPVLDDLVIESDPFGGFAEAHVKAAVTGWAAIVAGSDDAQKIRLRNAVAYYAAALLCKPLSSGAVGAAYGGDSSPIDWNARQKHMLELYGTVMSELLDLTTPTVTGDYLPQAMFRMAARSHGGFTDAAWMSFPPVAYVTPITDPWGVYA